MCTLVNRPPTPENLAHGLQSPTELPCKVRNSFHCLWPTGGWASWSIFTVRTELHRNGWQRLHFECSGMAVGGFPRLCPPAHCYPLLQYRQVSDACYLVSFHGAWNSFQLDWVSMVTLCFWKSSKEVSCFPSLGNFAYTWWASPHQRFVSTAIWKCPLEVD